MAGELPHTAFPGNPAGAILTSHTTAPVLTSNAAILPRNEQQTYPGISANVSSSEDVPTKTRLPNTVADCVMMAAGCVSSVVRHSAAPVLLLNARTFPPPPNGPWVPRISLLPASAGV